MRSIHESCLWREESPCCSLRKLPSADSIATGPHPISEVRAFQMGLPFRQSYVVLQVRTQSGLIGYGECNELLRRTSRRPTRPLPAVPRRLSGRGRVGAGHRARRPEHRPARHSRQGYPGADLSCARRSDPQQGTRHHPALRDLRRGIAKRSPEATALRAIERF